MLALFCASFQNLSENWKESNYLVDHCSKLQFRLNGNSFLQSYLDTSRGKYIYSKAETIPEQLFESQELFPGKFSQPT